MNTPNNFDQPQSLMEKTIELLQSKDLLLIYKDTGIPFYWLRTFRSGRTTSPSVNRVQYLYEYLVKKPLL
jgi:hypothetical protein